MCPLGTAVARLVQAPGSFTVYMVSAWYATVCLTHRTGGTSGDKGRRGTMHFTYTLRVLYFGSDINSNLLLSLRELFVDLPLPGPSILSPADTGVCVDLPSRLSLCLRAVTWLSCFRGMLADTG